MDKQEKKELTHQIVSDKMSIYLELKKQKYFTDKEYNELFEQKKPIPKDLITKKEMLDNELLTGGSVFNGQELSILDRELHNLRKRKGRLNNCNNTILLYAYLTREYLPFFFTLTFKNKYIENKETTLTRYAKKTFQDLMKLGLCGGYNLNVDYGKKKNRFHFHGVVLLKLDSLENKTKRNRKTKREYYIMLENYYKYGRNEFALILPELAIMEPVKIVKYLEGNNSPKRIATYQAKLVNHSFKDTAKRLRTIYSNNFGKIREKVQELLVNIGIV